jgi:hypothetical protein
MGGWGDGEMGRWGDGKPLSWVVSRSTREVAQPEGEIGGWGDEGTRRIVSLGGF